MAYNFTAGGLWSGVMEDRAAHRDTNQLCFALQEHRGTAGRVPGYAPGVSRDSGTPQKQVMRKPGGYPSVGFSFWARGSCRTGFVLLMGYVAIEQSPGSVSACLP